MIDFVDLPPRMQERVVCSIEAANKYKLPPNILLAVAEREGGRPGQWVKNTNGTHDVGSLQFNTAYLKSLRKYSITPEDVAQPGCYPYYLAAWRIKRHIVYDKQGDIWTKVANYHSYTPKYNARYRAGIIKSAAKWEKWLTNRNVPTNTPVVQVKPVDAATPTQPKAKIQPAFYTPRANYVPRTIRVINNSPNPASE